jgi:uncharacterized repeat protein (TIGR01451 family)
MSGRKAIISAVVCLVGLHVAVSAFAQEELGAPPRRPSLSERLQRFRHDLLGDSNKEPRPRVDSANLPSNARASTKSTGRSRPVMVSPPAPQSQTADSYAPPFTQPQVGHTSATPQRMQLQSARRAQSGAPPVTVVTPDSVQPTPSEIGGLRRKPVLEARRRAIEPIAEESEAVEVIEADAEPQAEEEAEESNESVENEEVPADEPTLAVESETPADGDASEMEDADLETEVQVEADAAAESTSEPEAIEPNVPSSFERNSLRPTPAEVDEPQAVETAEEVETTVAPEEPVDGILFTSQSPVLAVAASGPRTVMIGKEAEFVVRVTNSGAAANNVVIKVIIPNYADVASCRSSSGTAQPPSRGELNSGMDWTLERLEANAEETLTLKLIPRKSSPLDLAISYTFAPETSQTMVEVQEPKLAMSISGPTEVLFGQTKVYKLTISNPGNGATQNVSVGLLPIGRGGEAQGTHRLGTLDAGESKTIDIELTARQAGSITIKAQSFADGGLRAEAAEEVLVRRAELQVSVEAPHVKYAGTPATYQIKVQNSGDALAEGVELSAILPPESKFLSASGGRLDPQQGRVTWGVGALPAGGERTFELQCALNTPGENRLQVAVDGGGELTATALANTRVEAIADLKLEVRDPQGPVAVGDDAVYEIRIRNRGTKAAQSVDLAVFFSEGLEPSAAEGGPHDLGSGQVVFRPITSIAAGDTAVFHVRAKAAAPGNHVFRAEVVCSSLDTKLAAEEATHFYGDQRTASALKREPTLARPQEASEPKSLEEDAPPQNPYE